MKALPFILLIGFAPTLQAQSAFEPLWDHIYGGELNETATEFRATSDGGYIVACHSRSGISGHKTQENRDSTNATYDYWVIKLDSLGELEWERTLGGSGEERVRDVRETPDGGFVVAGGSNSTISGDRTEANYNGGTFLKYDYWIVKLAADGTIQWDKRYGGNGDEVCEVILPEADGGYLLCGTSDTYLGGDKTIPNWLNGTRNIWMVRIDSSRNVIWQRVLGSPPGNLLADVLATDDHGLLILGTTSGASGRDVSEWGSGDPDIWVARLDSLGALLWENRIGGILLDKPKSIVAAGDGGYVIASHSRNLTNPDKTQTNYDPTGFTGDYWILKINAQGAIEWDRTLGTSYHEYMYGEVIRTLDGGFLAIGESEAPGIEGDKTEANLGFFNGWMVKLDADGNTEWDRTLFDTGGGSEHRIVQQADSSLVIATHRSGSPGGYCTDTPVGASDLWIIKFRLHDVTTSLSSDLRPGGRDLWADSDGTIHWAIADEADVVDALILYDASGRCLHSMRPSTGVGQWRPEGLAAAVYVIRARMRSGGSLSRTILLR